MSARKRKIPARFRSEDDIPVVRTKQKKIVKKCPDAEQSVISDDECIPSFHDNSDLDPDWSAERYQECSTPDGDDGTSKGKEMKKERHKKKTKEKKRKKNKVKKKKHEDRLAGKAACEKTNDDQDMQICTVCNKEFRTLRALSQHLGTHKANSRGSGSSKRETCHICMRELTKWGMRDHLEHHREDESHQSASGPFKCLNCLKLYHNEHKMRMHQAHYCPLNATGEKELNSAADVVDLSADQRKNSDGVVGEAQVNEHGSLQTHKTSHTKKSSNGGRARIKCPHCTATFSNFWMLEYHNTIVHVNKGVATHKCDVCSYQFTHENLLRFHKKRAHGKDRFKCRHCQKLFTSIGERSKHEKNSHLKPPKLCEYCGQVVPKTSRFTKHRCAVNPKRRPVQKKRKKLFTKTATSSDYRETNDKDEPTTAPVLQQYREQYVSRSKRSEYMCYICNISFENKTNYIIHQSTCQVVPGKGGHEGDGQEDDEQNRCGSNAYFGCKECPKIFPSINLLRVHEAEHLWKACEDCGAVVPDEESFELHALLECPDRYKLFSKHKPKETTLSKSVLKILQNEKPVTPRIQVEKAEGVEEAESVEPAEGVDESYVRIQVAKKRDSYQCKMCARHLKKCSLEGHKASHMVDIKNQIENGEFECAQCLKRYHNLYHLSRHVRFYCKLQAQAEAESGNLQAQAEVESGTLQAQAEAESGNLQAQAEVESGTLQAQAEAESGKLQAQAEVESSNEVITVKGCSSCSQQFEDVELYLVHKRLHVIHSVASQTREGNEDSEDDSGDEMDEEQGENLSKDMRAQKGSKQEELATNVEYERNDQLSRDEERNGGSRKRKLASRKTCDSCGVKFCSSAALKEHKKRVSMLEAKYPSKCLHCPNLGRPEMFSACHYLQHKKQFKFLCEFCGLHFEKTSVLRKHLHRMHDFETKMECQGCHFVFGSQAYQQHLEYNRRELEHLDHKCLACGKMFESLKELAIHSKRFNQNTCNICGQHFYHFNQLRTHHLQGHNLVLSSEELLKEKAYRCKHCTLSFAKSSQLSAHVKSVLMDDTSESPLCSWEYRYSTCLRCGMSFAKYSDYKLHKSIWNLECTKCNEHFKNWYSYRRHQTNVHERLGTTNTISSNQPQYFKCKYCGHTFDTVRDKRKHEFRTNFGITWKNWKEYNTGKFPVPCEDCGESLGSVCDIDNHTVKHHKLKAVVSCRFCRQSFRRVTGNVSLSSHTKLLDEDCATCGVKLINLCQKKMHNRKHREESRQEGGEKKMYENLRCVYCGIMCKTIQHKRVHETSAMSFKKDPKATCRCSICCQDLAKCQVKKHTKHLDDEVFGKKCAYCGEVIDCKYRNKESEQSSLFHRKFRDKAYVCGCGERLQGRCQKQQHETNQFVCQKCSRHFGTFNDLLQHLAKFNYTNVKIGNKTNECRGIELMEESKWAMVEAEEEKVYKCLYCGDKARSLEEKNEHNSAYKFECPQCKKHFRTLIAATYHFRKVKHESIPRRVVEQVYGRKEGRQKSKISKKQQQKNEDEGDVVVKKTGGLKLRKKNRKQEVQFDGDNLLQLYCEQSLCDQFFDQYKEKESQIQQSVMEFQIGLDVYGIVTNRDADFGRDSMNDSGDENDNQGFEDCRPDFSSFPVTSFKNSSSKPRVPRHICPCCKKKFGNGHMFRQHMFSIQQPAKGLFYTCVKCDQSFDSECGMQYHVARLCQHCGEHFEDVENKVSHEQQCQVSSEVASAERIDVDNTKTVGRIAGEIDNREEIAKEVEVKSVSRVGNNAEKLGGADKQGNGKEISIEVNVKSMSGVKNTDEKAREGGDGRGDQEEVAKQVDEAVEVMCNDVTVGQEGTSQVVISDVQSGMHVSNRNDDMNETKIMIRDRCVNGKRDVEDIGEEASRLEKDVPIHAIVAVDERKEKAQQNSAERNSSRIRKRNARYDKMTNFFEPATHYVAKRASENNSKCEFCLKTSSKSYKEPCYQNDASLKWLKCVCLQCDLELPTVCHISYHHNEYSACCWNYGMHFSSTAVKQKHTCFKCKQAPRRKQASTGCELYFQSEANLQDHMANWHTLHYKEVLAIPPIFNPSECGRQRTFDTNEHHHDGGTDDSETDDADEVVDALVALGFRMPQKPIPVSLHVLQQIPKDGTISCQPQGSLMAPEQPVLQRPMAAPNPQQHVPGPPMAPPNPQHPVPGPPTAPPNPQQPVPGTQMAPSNPQQPVPGTPMAPPNPQPPVPGTPMAPPNPQPPVPGPPMAPPNPQWLVPGPPVAPPNPQQPVPGPPMAPPNPQPPVPGPPMAPPNPQSPVPGTPMAPPNPQPPVPGTPMAPPNPQPPVTGPPMAPPNPQQHVPGPPMAPPNPQQPVPGPPVAPPNPQQPVPRPPMAPPNQLQPVPGPPIALPIARQQPVLGPPMTMQILQETPKDGVIACHPKGSQMAQHQPLTRLPLGPKNPQKPVKGPLGALQILQQTPKDGINACQPDGSQVAQQQQSVLRLPMAAQNPQQSVKGPLMASQILQQTPKDGVIVCQPQGTHVAKRQPILRPPVGSKNPQKPVKGPLMAMQQAPKYDIITSQPQDSLMAPQQLVVLRPQIAPQNPQQPVPGPAMTKQILQQTQREDSTACQSQQVSKLAPHQPVRPPMQNPQPPAPGPPITMHFLQQTQKEDPIVCQSQQGSPSVRQQPIRPSMQNQQQSVPGPPSAMQILQQMQKKVVTACQQQQRSSLAKQQPVRPPMPIDNPQQPALGPPLQQTVKDGIIASQPQGSLMAPQQLVVLRPHIAPQHLQQPVPGPPITMQILQQTQTEDSIVCQPQQDSPIALQQPIRPSMVPQNSQPPVPRPPIAMQIPEQTPKFNEDCISCRHSKFLN